MLQESNVSVKHFLTNSFTGQRLTCIPDATHCERWACKEVFFIVARLECHHLSTCLIAHQCCAWNTSPLSRVPIKNNTRFTILNIEPSYWWVMRHLFAQNFCFATAINICPVHEPLLTKHRIVRLLLPLSLGHTSSVRCIQVGYEPFNECQESFHLAVRLRNSCKQFRLGGPVFATYKC